MEMDPLQQVGLTSSELSECLCKFRMEHAIKRISYRGTKWEYITGGTGDKVLLVLPGAFRSAESSFNFIRLFEGAYHVITPTYPPLLAVKEMMDGIINILDNEALQNASLLGQSYGGWMAQLLIHSYPERFVKLVLSSTGPLTISKNENLMLSQVLKILPKIPTGFLRKLLKRGFRSELAHFPTQERLFWEGFSDDLFARLTKADILSHFQVVKDAIDQGYMVNESEKSSFGGQVLIIGSDNDRFVSGKERERLLHIYPQARIEVIPGAGHIAAISEPGKYAEVVRGFLG